MKLPTKAGVTRNHSDRMHCSFIYCVGDIVDVIRESAQPREEKRCAGCNAVEVHGSEGWECLPVDCLEFLDEDNGDKEEFSTGAKRDQRTGKGRFDLLSPIALRELALHCEHGAEHYGDRNWEKGMPVCRILDSALRHINQYREGRRDEPHLRAALWNLMAAVHVAELAKTGALPAELDDAPTYQPTEQAE